MDKKVSDLKVIGIAGAGTMGIGIAQVFALAGFEVVVFDVNKATLETFTTQLKSNLDKGVEKGKIKSNEASSAFSRVKTVEKIESLKADVIIEAIIEDLKIKQEFFQELERINTPESILLTNTSSIPITQIAAVMQHPNRFAGMHFFNPAHIMPLVEVVSGVGTSPDVIETIKALTKFIGKTPVEAKDMPGFIVNRVARHFYVEALKVLEEGVGDHETIDTLMEGAGFKMGPFRLMDLIGVDTNFSVTTSIYNGFHQAPRFRPSLIQHQKVLAGHIGRKAGKGFYNY